MIVMTDVEVFDVIKPFSYAGKDLVKGDEWSPAGGKWDEQMIDAQVYVKSRDPLAEEHKQTRVRVANERVGKTDPAWILKLGMTLEKAREMIDEDLLALKGIGPARLKEIRA